MALFQTIFLLFYMSFVYFSCVSEKITYISVERPAVLYFNPKYMAYINLTSHRYGRKNPVYYVGVHFSNVIPFDNNLIMDFYIFEWLTNVYKRSFIEFHYTWCNLLEKDMFFGAAMRQGKLLKPCPHLPDQYHLVNMTIHPGAIPPGFPFTRGRIYCNMSRAKTKERVAEGYIDMRVEQINKKDARKMFNNYNNQ